MISKNVQQLNTIIKMAITAEENAYNFYCDAEKNATVHSAKILFNQLANQEKVHRQLLLKIKPADLKSNSKFADTLKLAKSVMLTPLNELLALRKVIQFAIKKEQQSFDMYMQLYKKIETKKSKQLLLYLAKQEANHKALLIKTENICFP